MESNKNKRTAAIVLAAGSGKRMHSSQKKQFMPINGKPMIYYSLCVFEESFIDDIILVVSSDDIDYCRQEIVERYGFQKVIRIVDGGAERYHSVYYGLTALSDCEYLFIHDGARPLLSQDILSRAFETVKETNACVVGMPVKDTIAIVDAQGFIEKTPNRETLWMAQTPQVFRYNIIKSAYDKLMMGELELQNQGIVITDDAMVVEQFSEYKVKYIEGSYQNIKVTTPEDIFLAEMLLKSDISSKKSKKIQ